MLAERSFGFVWRLQSEAGNATDIQTTSDLLFIVNMSVWLGAEALFDFVYRSAHTPEMARRRDYFERFEGAYQALWWVPAGHVPTVDEGLSRLWRLILGIRHGHNGVSIELRTDNPRRPLAEVFRMTANPVTVRGRLCHTGSPCEHL